MEFVIGGWLNNRSPERSALLKKTVKVHRGRVMHKMDAHTVAELIPLC